MIPATEAGATPLSAPNGAGMDNLATQNLFEHIAGQQGSTLQATTPAELGSNIMNALENPIEQAQSFASALRAQREGHVASSDHVSSSNGMPSNGTEGLGDVQFDRMLDSLTAMFDHATLMKLMSSCASQTSGAFRTLLRGQ